MPDGTRETRPWCLILNTEQKDLSGTHWLALYAPQSGPIEFFDSFSFSFSMYGFDSLDPLHLLYSLQSPSSFVCGHYCIFYIYRRSCHTSQNQNFHLFINISNRDLWVTKYIHNFKTFFCILNLCYHIDQCYHLKCQFCWTKWNKMKWNRIVSDWAKLINIENVRFASSLLVNKSLSFSQRWSFLDFLT